MKPYTESNILITKISVQKENHYRGEYFAEVSARWQQEPWVKYLYTYGTIKNINTYEEPFQFSTVYVIYWNLDEKKKTFVLLKWSEQIDKIYT